MDKHVIFISTEQRQKFFQWELCRSINKLKDEKANSNDASNITVRSISVCGRRSTRNSTDKDSDNNNSDRKNDINSDKTEDKTKISEKTIISEMEVDMKAEAGDKEHKKPGNDLTKRSESGAKADTDITDNVVLLEHSITDDNDPLQYLPLLEHLPILEGSEEEEEFRGNDYVSVAEQLHSIADSFGAPGSYLPYVIWCIEAYIPDPGEVCEIYAALHRLQSWHNACLVFLTPDPSYVIGWPSALPLQITNDANTVMSGVVRNMWRGDLVWNAFSSTSQHSATTPTGAGSVPDTSDRLSQVIISCVAGQSLLNQERSKGNKVFMVPELELVTRVQLASVPCLLTRPGCLYQISTAADVLPEHYEHAADVLSMLTGGEEVGTLLRLRYSTSTAPALHGSLQSLSTQEWKKQLGDGVFDTAPVLRFPATSTSTAAGPVHHVIHLLVVSKGSKKGTVRAVCLRSPSSLGEDVWRLVAKTPSTLALDNTQEQRDLLEKLVSLLSSTPTLSKQQLNVLAHLQLNLPIQMAKKLKDKGNVLTNLWETTKDDLEILASQQILELLQGLENGPSLEIHSSPLDIASEIELDKSQWPEYQALVEAERRAELEAGRSSKTGQLLGGLAPPPTHAIITLDAAHLTQIFQQDPCLQQHYYKKNERNFNSGSASINNNSNNRKSGFQQSSQSSSFRNNVGHRRSSGSSYTINNMDVGDRHSKNTHSNDINRNNNSSNDNYMNSVSDNNTSQLNLTKLYSTVDQYPFKANTSCMEARSAEWPEALLVHHHDIYYNRDDKRERYEEECNDARQRHIRREFASTCTLFQDKDMFVTRSNGSNSATAAAAANIAAERSNNRALRARTNTGSSGPRPVVSHQRYPLLIDDAASVRSASSNCAFSAAAMLRRSPRKRSNVTEGSTTGNDLMKPSDLLAPKKQQSSGAGKPSDLLSKRPQAVGRRTLQPNGLGARKPGIVVAAELSDVHKQKLRGAVLTALNEEGIEMKNKLFKVCFKKLFAVCKPFATDVIGRGSTSRNMEKIARSHVKQVIEFETNFGKR